jgi:hypothetical protein
VNSNVLQDRSDGEAIGKSPIWLFSAKAGKLMSGSNELPPPQLFEELETATPEQLAAVKIVGNGYGLYWEALDADVALPGLIFGVFGTQAWMARCANQATVHAKAAAYAGNAPAGQPSKSASA